MSTTTSSGLREYLVDRDRFQPDESFGGFAFPCFACIHIKKQQTDEPCRACDHNINAQPNSEGEYLPRAANARTGPRPDGQTSRRQHGVPVQ